MIARDENWLEKLAKDEKGNKENGNKWLEMIAKFGNYEIKKKKRRKEKRREINGRTWRICKETLLNWYKLNSEKLKLKL